MTTTEIKTLCDRLETLATGKITLRLSEYLMNIDFLESIYKTGGANNFYSKTFQAAALVEREDLCKVTSAIYEVLRKRQGLEAKTEIGIDLFEDYENIPENLQKVLDKHQKAFEDGCYKGLLKAFNAVEKIGYTFEYYLDGQAYDLRPIGTKGKTEVWIENN